MMQLIEVVNKKPLCDMISANQVAGSLGLAEQVLLV